MTSRQEPCDFGCNEAREAISAMLDGGAGEGETAALQAHNEHCAECAAYCENARALDDRLRAELTGPCDFDRIWGAVQHRIALEDDEAPRSETAPRRGAFRDAGARYWAGMAVAAMILLGVFAGGTLLMRMDARALPIVTETVRDFETFRVRGGLLDVAANQPERVRQWIASKLDFNLPADVNPPDGFQLAGGRLCSFLNRRLAFLHYRKGSGTLSLYVMKAAGLEIPEQGAFRAASSANGLTTVTWQQKDLAFVVVSNLSPPDVTAFAASFRGRALAPALGGT